MKHKKIKAAVLAITAIAALGGILYSQFGTKKSYDYADYYVETKPAKNNTSDKEASEKELSLSLLKQTNKDIVGILVFDDRVIYEPIVQAPDNDFYVRRNIEKQYANAGIPFVSADGNIDSQNVVIYGHSSKWNNIIFTSLMSYIDENYYKETISLNEVADAVNMSANYLSAIFSQNMQKTFVEYITCKRVDRAKKLLRETDKSSGEIAQEVGYKDPHYFSYVFKKKSGCSPREYRSKGTA